MKIQVNENQLTALKEAGYNYDKNDVRRTIPRSLDNRKIDDTTLQQSTNSDTGSAKYEPKNEDEDKINKVRSKLIFYFDKTYDKIAQLEKDIIKEKYGSMDIKTDDYRNPNKRNRNIDPSRVIEPKKIKSPDSDRVRFSEKKVADLKNSLEYVKGLLQDEKKLLELYNQGTFSVEPHSPKNPQQKGGDPEVEPSRKELRKHMLDLRKRISDLDKKEDKTPQEIDLLKKYKEEYDKEFESGMMY